MTNLNPDIKRQQRQRDLLLWQTHFGERAGKAETMQQAKSERHQPRPPPGNARAPLMKMKNLASDKQDAQRDHGLHRRLRHVHPTERGGSQRQTVRDGEGCDGRDQSACAVDDEQQRQHK